MDMISLQGKTNFFEGRVSEYALAGSSHSVLGPPVARFSTTEEF